MGKRSHAGGDTGRERKKRKKKHKKEHKHSKKSHKEHKRADGDGEKSGGSLLPSEAEDEI